MVTTSFTPIASIVGGALIGLAAVMLMAFTGFALVLVAWVLYEFNMGFGKPLRLGPGILGSFVGTPHPILDPGSLQGKARIPQLDGSMPDFRYPKSTLAYFHFAFAAITPFPDENAAAGKATPSSALRVTFGIHRRTWPPRSSRP